MSSTLFDGLSDAWKGIVVEVLLIGCAVCLLIWRLPDGFASSKKKAERGGAAEASGSRARHCSPTVTQPRRPCPKAKPSHQQHERENEQREEDLISQPAVHPQVSAPKTCSQPSASAAQQVQQLLISLMNKSKAGSAEVLQQYDDLTKLHSAELQAELPDEAAANALFLGVITCSMQQTKASAQSQDTVMVAKSKKTRAWTSRVLRDMRHLGFDRSSSFYASVLKMLVGAHGLRDALWLYDQMMVDGCTPDATSYQCLFNSAVACNEREKALKFFASLRKLGAATLRCHMTLLRMQAKCQDWKGAVDLIMNMKGDPAPDVLMLNHVLGLCVSAGRVTVAKDIMAAHITLADTVSCNILMKGYAKEGMHTNAADLLKQMQTKGPSPNLITFNTAMDCEVRAMRAQATSSTRRLWELLDQLIALGFEPDRYTCSTLLKGMHIVATCTPTEIDRTTALLRHLGPEALQVPPEEATALAGAASGSTTNLRLLEVIFNTLLDVCVTARDLDRMTAVFGLMQEFHVSISSVTCGTLIKAFGQAGRLTRCHEVWREMREAGIKPAVVTYGCYIDACIRNSDLDGAESGLQAMLEDGLQPNVVIYTSLIKGFAQARSPLRALAWYHEMRSKGIEATVVTFNVVLEALARQPSTCKELCEVWYDMQKAGIAADTVTHSVLVKACSTSGNVDGALAFFERMRSLITTCDEVTCNSLLLACARADRVSDAEKVFNLMRAHGPSPTAVTASILIKMYGKAKMLDKAIAVSELIEQEFLAKPNLHVYTCLIQACVQNKQVRKSWEIFNQALKSGLEPDAVLYGTVIHGCIYMCKFDHAMCLVRHAYLQEEEKEGEPSARSLGLATTTYKSKRVVHLQSDVVQALSSAMKRKEQHVLCNELMAILARF